MQKMVEGFEEWTTSYTQASTHRFSCNTIDAITMQPLSDHVSTGFEVLGGKSIDMTLFSVCLRCESITS